MAADLSGVDAKIEWSKAHLAALTQAIEDTLKTHPYRFAGEMDPETGKYVLSVHDLPPTDPTWSLRVGDVVHNLRSALDHLAWQLVILDGGTPYKKTQFPIRKSPLKDGQPSPTQLQPAISNQAILDALEAVQPYRRPGTESADYRHDALWRLHRLDIIDKHRLLLVVRATLDVGGMWWGWWGEHDHPSKVWLNMAPLSEGDVVARFDNRGHEPPPEWDPHADISIVLNETPTLDLGHFSVVRVLESLLVWVEDYVVNDTFRPLFVA